MNGKKLMGSPRDEESLLARYLLGDLTEDEQVQVENRAFADGNYMATLEAVEADLIDAYVRGELSTPERLRFERLFLAAPSRRRKVDFARALASVADETKAAEPARHEGRPAWPSLGELIRGWSPARQLVIAMASLLLVAGVSWLAVENARVRSRVAALEAQQTSLRQQLGEEQGRAAALAAQVQKESGPRQTSPLAIASLVLLPGLSRAESAREQLVLRPSAQLARIEIQLEARDDYPRFRVELRTRSGAEVLTQSNLPRSRTQAGPAVSIEVPASALVSGDYELTLKGVTGNGTTPDIGFYYFSVQKR